MSQQNLMMFFQAVARDDSLKAKLEAIGARHRDQNLEESQSIWVWKNEILPLAKSAGFEFNMDDVTAYQATQSATTSKLADEELDTVVGGGNCTCVAGGGGTKGDNYPPCACVFGGAGADGAGGTRCYCIFYGEGGAL